MIHTLPDLPYAIDSLEPHLSQEQMAYHHRKHHQHYVDQLNKLIKGTQFESFSLAQIVQRSAGTIFNNAGQHWNHSFFWKCLTPDRPALSENLLARIQSSFKSLDAFEEEFVERGTNHFGSGWIWLIHSHERLHIETTHDGDTPLRHDMKAILGCDLWEHAYYLDYRNERTRFLEKFFKIVNWDFVSDNLKLTALEAAA